MMLAICAALRWEIRPILQSLGRVERVRRDQVTFWRAIGGPPVLVFQTGVGARRARHAAAVAAETFPVAAILNTGCAGSLVPYLEAGAVVVPDVLVQEGSPIRVLRDVPSPGARSCARRRAAWGRNAAPSRSDHPGAADDRRRKERRPRPQRGGRGGDGGMRRRCGSRRTRPSLRQCATHSRRRRRESVRNGPSPRLKHFLEFVEDCPASPQIAYTFDQSSSPDAGPRRGSARHARISLPNC